MAFVPLHIHSQYSILDSTASVKELAKKAKEYGIPSLALTDSGNMFGHVDFYKACKTEGIHPILGCCLRLAIGSRFEKKKKAGKRSSFPILLLAKDKEGYQNLCTLSSIGYVEGFYYYPRIDKEVLEKHAAGLICLSGGVQSYIGDLLYQNLEEEALLEIFWFQNVFSQDFYFELHRLSCEQEHAEAWVMQKVKEYAKKEEIVGRKLQNLSEQLGIQYVATNEIRYLEKEDWKGHEVLLNIQSGEPCEIWERDSSGIPKFRIPNPKRRIYPSHEFYFKSPAAMEDLFQDLPQALEQTLEIANKCTFEFHFKKKHYPVFIPPHLKEEKITQKERLKAVADHLYALCTQNIDKRYSKEMLEKIQKKYQKDPLSVIEKRLKYEFEIIASKNLCDYLLIVHDFISWAKKHHIPVGPGRGSVAGSIMAYLIGITDIDPLMLDLVFERFINPERISYPDIDVDICMERRQEVIDYTIKKYGKDKVAQIITFGTMKAKMAIRDVGRVLSIPLKKVDAIAKLVPEELHITLEKAIEIDPELRAMYHSDKDAQMIIDIGKTIEGSIRNTSIHAAGIIISADPITDYIPVCTAKDVDMLVTQFSMKPVESLGMLKIDFLGLKTLTAIQKAVEQIEKNTKKKIDIAALPLDDAKTYHLLNKGQTLGVFQLESGGMQELAKELHIDKFEEIIAVGALYRPGPMDMIPSFINRKHKKESIEIDHPLIQDILEETYGVMVYQEQVMQIASKLAGYSLAEGDVLRKAMGKKDRKEMARQKEKFLQGCLDRQIEESVALSIFHKIEKFAMYGFNKSHAAAYAYLSYTTAFLKAHYPKEWMASLLTCDQDDLSKVAKFIQECRVMGIAILSPDVNESKATFTATDKGIRFAMSGIKGIGRAVVEAIEEERVEKAYTSLFDFIQRIDKKRVGKKNIEILIEAGAFDFTKELRASLKSKVEKMYERASKEAKETEKGVMHFFSMKEEDMAFSQKEETCSTSILELLQKEKELLGFYLTSHPMASYARILQKLSCVPLKELMQQEHPSICRCAFIIDTVKIKISSKTQRKFAILTISDEEERLELPIWPDLYEKKSDLLQENQLIYAILQAERREKNFRLQCHFLEDLTKIDEKMVQTSDEIYDQAKNQVKMQNFKKNGEKEKKIVIKKIFVSIDADQVRFSNILKLKNIFLEHPGKNPLDLCFFSGDKKIATIMVDSSFWVNNVENVCNKIKEISGVRKVKVEVES